MKTTVYITEEFTDLIITLEADIEAEEDTYGEDADGNRGISCLNTSVTRASFLLSADLSKEEEDEVLDDKLKRDMIERAIERASERMV